MKKLTIMLLFTLLVGMVSAPQTYAGSKKPPKQTEEENVSIESTKFLRIWGQDLKNPSGQDVEIIARTITYSPVDKVGAILYLQRWDSEDGVWRDHIELGDFYTTNSDENYKYIPGTLLSGYYYRVRAIHYATDNYETEKDEAFSEYVYIK